MSIFSFSQDNEVTIKIDGMHCAAGCAMYIQDQLNKMDGIVEASIDFNESIGLVKFNDKTKQKKIINFVNELKGGAYNASIFKKKDCSKGKSCCKVTGKKNAACDKKSSGCCSSSKRECSKSKK